MSVKKVGVQADGAIVSRVRCGKCLFLGIDVAQQGKELTFSWLQVDGLFEHSSRGLKTIVGHGLSSFVVGFVGGLGFDQTLHDLAIPTAAFNPTRGQRVGVSSICNQPLLRWGMAGKQAAEKIRLFVVFQLNEGLLQFYRAVGVITCAAHIVHTVKIRFPLGIPTVFRVDQGRSRASADCRNLTIVAIGGGNTGNQHGCLQQGTALHRLSAVFGCCVNNFMPENGCQFGFAVQCRQ